MRYQTIDNVRYAYEDKVRITSSEVPPQELLLDTGNVVIQGRASNLARVQIAGAEGTTTVARVKIGPTQRSSANGVRTHARDTNLPALVAEGKKRLSRLFPGALITEDNFNDPDTDRTQLLVLVYTSLPVEEAMSRMRDFNREWWFAVMPTAKGALLFDFRLI